VTIFTGPNDVDAITAALGRGAGGANPAASIDDEVATAITSASYPAPKSSCPQMSLS